MTDIDIDNLFKKHTVSEIQDYVGKLRLNIENKKEELRVMVGERYRDLIEAADTIAEMQQTTKEIVDSIQTMESLCQSLKQRGLIGFKTDVSSYQTRKLEESNHYAIAAQIKILVDAPEVLWNLCDRQEFFSAAQLVLLSQHTHTALQLSPNAIQIFETFPIISSQWSSISHFKSSIIKGCCQTIKAEKDIQVIIKATAAIIMIENLSVEASLDRTLALRKSTLDAILLPKPTSVAKDQLPHFCALLIDTLYVISALFISEGDNSCLLAKTAQNQRETATISLLPETSLSLRFLPDSLIHFRWNPSTELNNINDATLRAKVDVWLKSIVLEGSDATEHLLSFTTSIKALTIIRSKTTESQVAEISPQWEKTLEKLGVKKDFNPWQCVIQKRLLDQAMLIATKELDKIKKYLLQLVESAVDEINKNKKVCQEEGDITNFIWSESAQDSPDQIGWMGNLNTDSQKYSGLFYKARGFTKRTQNLAKSFNTKLSLFLDDVVTFSKDLLYDKENSMSSEDYYELLKLVEENSYIVFSQCISSIRKMEEDVLHEQDSDIIQGKSVKSSSAILIFLSRFVTCIPILCPKFKMCLCASMLSNPESSKRLQLGLVDESSNWDSMLDLISSCSNKMLSKFYDQIISIVLSHFTDQLTLLICGSSADILSIFSNWEKMNIEEEDDDGKKMKSAIHIPSQPSPQFCQALFKLTTIISQLGIHTISNTSHHHLIQKLCSSISPAYSVIVPHIDKISQKAALQLIFDLSFIKSIIISKDTKEYNKDISIIVSKLEGRVDPFDLNVFMPHILSRVKSAAHRLQVIYGGVMPRNQQLITKSSGVGTTNTLILVPSVDIPRFSNVPIPVSSGFLSFDTKLQQGFHESKTTLDLSSMDKNEKKGIPSSRSTASLFSAMSSSWFGS